MSIELMWQYFLSPEFVQGAWMTLLITLCSLLCGVVLGLVLAPGEGWPFSTCGCFAGRRCCSR